MMPQDPQQTPGYRYHLLRAALEKYSRNLTQLDDTQLAEAHRQADKTCQLESLVLGSEEARAVVVPQEQLQAAFQEVAGRYSDGAAFEDDLLANGLNEEDLREALQRELLFDSVLQCIAARRLMVSQLDERLYYELHSDKFYVPEQRDARQILITVNEEFAENRREASLQRIGEIRKKLLRSPRRFSQLAKKHSECPTALEGGKLGRVGRGQLYAELDSVLFSLKEGVVSEVVESELGFHLLICDKVAAARTVPFSKARVQIHRLLDERNRRNCQKAFLKRLKENCDERVSV